MKNLIAALIVNLGASTSSFAAVDAQMEDLYQKATKAGGTAVMASYKAFKLAQKEDPSDPIALFYLGASETLMAKESWLPWRKVSYAENGIARMDKALTIIEEMDNPGRSSQGMPQDLLLKGIAATTFTKVPKFFNSFDRGFELYHELMGDPRIGYMPTDATRWIYCGALQAAELEGSKELVNLWGAKAESHGISNPCGDVKSSD
ncbi:hypothetical protein [Microbulbifer sp. VAAF005]|uniref:hypothetical protein n=1 Tax=Microbulbifer sp. VAAF005 TaxID=3034230 RepID=UPI0024ACCA6A|nr:hypothetical protein [Microbulbifer sp. VAAF005]WHI47969.1 hypothetical protein P0078_06185 [Microbulbifer sp. VAAF005]